MALHRKFGALMSLKPDVAVVCECADPERLWSKIDAPAQAESRLDPLLVERVRQILRLERC